MIWEGWPCYLLDPYHTVKTETESRVTTAGTRYLVSFHSSLIPTPHSHIPDSLASFQNPKVSSRFKILQSCSKTQRSHFRPCSCVPKPGILSILPSQQCRDPTPTNRVAMSTSGKTGVQERVPLLQDTRALPPLERCEKIRCARA